MNSFVLPSASQMCANKDFSKETLENYFSTLICLYNKSQELEEKKLDLFFKKVQKKQRL